MKLPVWLLHDVYNFQHGENRSDVTFAIQLVTYDDVASITQPGNYQPQIFYFLSGLLRVLISYQDGCNIQIIRLVFLWCSSLFLKCNSYCSGQEYFNTNK